MSNYTRQTIGRYFDIDLDDLKKDIEQQYDLKILAGFEEINEGYVNAIFKIKTDIGSLVLRIFGDYDENSEIEMDVMNYLSVTEITPEVIKSKSGKLISSYKDYKYSLLEFIVGTMPNFEQSTYFRIGEAVGKLNKLLKDYPKLITRKNRYIDVIDRKDEISKLIYKNISLLRNILTPEDFSIVERQQELFDSLDIKYNSHGVVHSDIYRNNLLDDGNNIYILDFEYVGIGGYAIDHISYAAWDGADFNDEKLINSNEITKNLLNNISSYVKGIKTQVELADKHTLFDTMVFLNIGDSVYNLEKAIKMEQNLYRGYIHHWEKAQELIRNKDEITSLLN